MDWLAGSRLHLVDIVVTRGLSFVPLYVLATPQFHHWHHSVEPVDVNFAVHLPILDRIFGTHYLPGDRWPGAYGLAGRPVPDGYWAQTVLPFRRAGS